MLKLRQFMTIVINASPRIITFNSTSSATSCIVKKPVSLKNVGIKIAAKMNGCPFKPQVLIACTISKFICLTHLFCNVSKMEASSFFISKVVMQQVPPGEIF